MSEESTKKFPVASNEVAKIFGMNESDKAIEHGENEFEPEAKPGDLPVAQSDAKPKSNPNTFDEEKKDKNGTNGLAAPKIAFNPVDAHTKGPAEAKYSNKAPARGFTSWVLALGPYLLVFILGLALYFFFFSRVNFSSLFGSGAPSPVTVQQSAILNLEKQSQAAYSTWINGFYFDVTDSKITDPNTDNSGNGLSNFEKYLLNLNPRSYDTLGLGMSDSEALARGINPLTGNKLTDQQQKIIDQYFDLEAIMNRLTLAKMQSASAAGASAGSLIPEAGPDVIYANDLNINTSVPGKLEIRALKISAPLVWSNDSNNFENDLKNGVIHYPGTALPGQIGTSYISGHSSNYVWIKSSYNQIFSKLGDLANDQSFQITVTLQSGKTATLHYAVVGRNIFGPTDQAQFANTAKSVMALSTCWPVGTSQNRLVVFGELTQIDR